MAQDTDVRACARPTRRTLTRAAAWSVPAIAVAAAAPAFAASPCDVRVGEVLDWDGSRVAFTRTSTTARAVLDPDATGPVPSLTLDVVATYSGNMKAGDEAGSNPNPNLRVTSPIGGLGVSGLSLWQATTSASPRGAADQGTYTFTFSRPVSNLVFTVTDIDSQGGDFWDVLRLSPGYVVENRPNTVASDKNGGSERFYASTSSAPADNASGSGGNLRVRYPGPVSTFTISYYNGAASFQAGVDNDQAIYVSDMTFDYKPC